MNPNSTGTQNAGGAISPPRGYALSGKIMLSAIVILFTIVLLILFLHLYVRWHVINRASRRARRRRRLNFAADAMGPAPAAKGLDPEIVKSLPVVLFSDGEDEGDDVAECAVCLNDFVEGEKVRSLPRCGHRFHIECIDMWFHSHATCPLCRAAVEAAEQETPAEIAVDLGEAAPPQPLDLCSSCRRYEDEVGSSSAESGEAELRIEIPARRGLEEEVGTGSAGGFGFKSPGNRILALKRLLSRDLRLCRGAEPDLERGEGAERAPSASPPAPPPPPAPPAPPAQQ